MPRPESPIWVRIGGGFELVPGGARHGPAAVSLPPPGDWKPLVVEGELVGWGQQASDELAREALAARERLVVERRSHLLGRLDHKLRSSVLSLQETARAAAFGRTNSLEAVYLQAEEVGRRAGALAAAALDPKDQSRSVVLAAAVAAAGAPGNEVPSDAIVFAPERVLVDAIARSRDWMGGSAARVDAERAQEWWRLDISGSRRQLEVAEVGEPLLRHLVEVQAGGWLDASDTRRLAIYLPAA